MVRYSDYLPLWSGTTYKSTKNRERKWYYAIQIFVAASVLINVYYFYTILMGWPSPLDNYQALNTYPIIDPTTLKSLGPVNPHENAIVTGLYTDAFAVAVATLGHTLNEANSSASRILLYLPDKISQRALCIATASGFQPQEIVRIPPPFTGVHRHFLDQYSKLHLWKLDQAGFKGVVYVDADAIVRRSFDELFALPFAFAAVPDVYVPDPGFSIGFNAGVMFVRPSTSMFEDMVAKIATAQYPAEQAEQAFLNQYYGAEAVRLPYAYNANIAIKKRSPRLWAGMQDELRIMHLTVVKPFLQGDYDEVEMDKLEKNAEKVMKRKGGAYKEEVTEWLEAWRETRRTYGHVFARCNDAS